MYRVENRQLSLKTFREWVPACILWGSHRVPSASTRYWLELLIYLQRTGSGVQQFSMSSLLAFLIHKVETIQSAHIPEECQMMYKRLTYKRVLGVMQDWEIVGM